MPKEVFDPLRVIKENATLNFWEGATQTTFLRSMPIKAFFEITNKCNISCIMCGRKLSSGGIMSRSLLDKIESFLPYLLWMCPFGGGEPLLAKGILFDLITRLRNCNLVTEVNITTNGTLIDERMAKRLILSGVSHLTISFDGASRETYEKIRKRARFDKVIDNIERVNQIKRLYHRKNPRLCFAFVAMRQNIEELPQLIELASKLRVSLITVVHLEVNREEMHQESLIHYPDLTNRIFDLAREKAKEKGIRLVLPALFSEVDIEKSILQSLPSHHKDISKRKSQGKCYEPWSTIYIHMDGKVRPCCRGEIMGDLNEEGFEQIWNGEAYQELRLRVNSDDPPEYCRNCPK